MAVYMWMARLVRELQLTWIPWSSPQTQGTHCCTYEGMWQIKAFLRLHLRCKAMWLKLLIRKTLGLGPYDLLHCTRKTRSAQEGMRH